MFKFRKIDGDTDQVNQFINASIEIFLSFFWRLWVLSLPFNFLYAYLWYLYDFQDPSVIFFVAYCILLIPLYALAMKWAFIRSKVGRMSRLMLANKDVTNDFLELAKAAMSILIRSVPFTLVLDYAFSYFLAEFISQGALTMMGTFGGLFIGFLTWVFYRYKSESILVFVDE